jgi:molybdopterin-guanine dinucleotide biosynthesis protein A
VHAALTDVPVDGIWIAGPLDGLADEQRAAVHPVIERPRYSGPLAGVAAAVADMPPDAEAVVLIVAGDVPYANSDDLERLATTCARTGRAASGTGEDGRLQHLCAAWPDPLLRARLADIGDPANTAVRRLWEGTDPILVEVSPGSVEDFDTPDDLQRITGGTGHSRPESQSQSPS